MLLTAYPSITRDEFQQACQAFESRCQDGRRLDGTDWLSVTWTGEEVRIKQRRKEQWSDEEEQIINFSIAYSSTYSVPVLWFWSLRLSTAAHVHAIVAEHLDQAVRSVGVMGAISQAYHPVTDMPAFFIHPCNTHSAMRAVDDGERLSQEDYLLIWLGLTGSSIGLHVPSHLLTHSVG
ncbi:hypothetical protein DV738_g2607, partial [Chaetothyriales sp. CBS 135597]